MNHNYFYELEEEYEEEKLKYGIWCARNEEIKISDMSERHLKNTINKIKNEDWRTWALMELEKELENRRK